MTAKSTFIQFLLGTAVLGFASSCSQSLYKVTDFTPEKQFVAGAEGVSCDKSGDLYVVSIGKPGTIGKIGSDGIAELFVELPQGSVGNGIRFGEKEKMYVADSKSHRIFAVNTDTRIVTEFAHEASMSQPNDLALSLRFIYASDPNWTNETGRIWKIDQKGRFTLVESKMGTVNGIEVSPDEKLLYVSETVQRKIWVFDLDEYGNTTNKRLFYEFPDYGLDGIRCDIKGNVYVARREKGTIVMLSPEGNMLREIYLKGKMPTNISFGGKGHKTIFVPLADRGCVEKFTVEFPGRD